MLQTQMDQNQDVYLAAYEKSDRAVGRVHPEWLRQLRESAITRFRELGFPGRRNEDWKYTNLAALQNVAFELPKDRALIKEDDIGSCLFGDSLQLVFVNGRFCSELSRIGDLPDGCKLADLPTAIKTNENLVKAHLARYADHDSLALTALNTAFLNDGAFLFVPGGTAIDKPVHIVQVSANAGEPVMAFPRLLVVAGKSSQVTVVESFVSLDENANFNNAVTEIRAEENAVVDHYKVVRESNQAFHIANLQVSQERCSNVFSHYFALSGGLVRNESRTVFNGTGGECTFNGLYLGSGKQHIDNHTVIDHAQPHCHSYELYKGLLDHKAKAVFNGKIFVRPDAQKTDAKQNNHCILLSDDATIDTKPQLEIYADDVKCTHGATIGQLDDAALFYLRSRGIAAEQAQSLLVFAFANDIIQRIKVDAVRAQLEDLLLTRQQLPRYQEI